MVLFGQKLLYSGKSGYIRAKTVLFGKMVVIEKSGSIQARWLHSCKVVIFGQKWLYSGKVIALGQYGCIRGKWLYSSKVVVFWQSGCIRAKEVVFE